MRLLKQSTAYNWLVFMTDSADHVSGKTGLTLTITLSKDGGAFSSISPTVTERTNGWYNVALTASHSDTLGDIALHITATGADPTDTVGQVRANVLGDTLPANVIQIGSDSQSATDLKDFADAGYDPSTNKVQGVVLVDTTTVATDAESDIATLAAAVAALNDISAADVWAAATRTLTSGANIALAKGTGVTGFNDLSAADVRTAIGLASANLDTQLDALPTAAENADAVWDEAASGHTTNGTFGKYAADILADTNELQVDWTNGGRLDLLIDDIISDLATIDSELGVVDSNVDSILLDTGTDGVPLTSAAIDAIHDEPITEPLARPAWSSMTHRKIQQTLAVMMLNEINSDADSVDVRNDADSGTLWSYPSSDDGTTYISGKAA